MILMVRLTRHLIKAPDLNEFDTPAVDFLLICCFPSSVLFYSRSACMCVWGGSLFRVGLVALVINMGEEIKSGSVKKKPQMSLGQQSRLKMERQAANNLSLCLSLGKSYGFTTALLVTVVVTMSCLYLVQK